MVNRRKVDALRAQGEVSELIERFGTLVFCCDIHETVRLESDEEIDLVVSLGGDGTILSLVETAGAMGLPLLGVNLGKLGFLAEYDLEAVRRDAARLFGQGELTLRDLDLLEAQVFSSGQETPTWAGSALNDVVLTAGPPYRMISVSLRVDGDEGTVVSGDGLVVATATGSTAYTLSAGGPILEPSVRAIVITPIAVHTLSFRPIVVDAHREVELRLECVNNDDGHGTTLLADGRPEMRLGEGDRVVVTMAGAIGGGTVRFVTNPQRSYWATLVEKLGWAQAPRFREDGA